MVYQRTAIHELELRGVAINHTEWSSLSLSTSTGKNSDGAGHPRMGGGGGGGSN